MNQKADGDASAARHAERRRAAVFLVWLFVVIYAAFALVMGLAPSLLSIPTFGTPRLPLGMPIGLLLMLLFPLLMAWYVRRHGKD